MRYTLALILLVLLAGCIGGTGQVGEPLPTTATNVTADIRLTLTANTTEIRPGETTHIDVVAQSERPSAIFYRRGCMSSWSFGVMRDSEAVDWTEPRAQCQGFSEATLAANETEETAFVWDGRVWDGEEYQDAPSGVYRVRTTFTFQEHPEAEQRDVTTTLRVRVR